MAREWQPVPSLGLLEQDVLPIGDDRFATSHRPQRLDRTWSSNRGAVLWEGIADLSGSFPGFALWGSRAQSVHLTLTDRFLLVDEASDHGFGLPIGWLSAAQALTGVEPIALESGDRLRICYVDGNRVRGFIVRIRGGRFGRSASRRANLLGSAAITLGLASTSPSNGLLLPPEHDLALDWDDFASYEDEPVIWTGRATMPVASGLEPATCDVWLTSASLIWGARSRAGIFRLPTASLTGITVAETPGRDPVIYWSLGGTHHTQVDLPMIFTRHDRAGRETAPERSLLSVLEEHDYHVDQPATPPRPWLAAPPRLRSAPEAVSHSSPVDHAPAPGATTGEQGPPAGTTIVSSTVGPEQMDASRRRLLDDGLFPERTVPSMPRSQPLPWGDRVERSDEERLPASDPDGGSGQDGQSPDTGQPAANLAAAAGRLRIWPPAAPRRDTAPSGIDAAAMLVRRPPVRATTTEEFLAAERAARSLAAPPPAVEGQSLITSPAERAVRGVIVRFRHPEAVPAGTQAEDRRDMGPVGSDAILPVAGPAGPPIPATDDGEVLSGPTLDRASVGVEPLGEPNQTEAHAGMLDHPGTAEDGDSTGLGETGGAALPTMPTKADAPIVLIAPGDGSPGDIAGDTALDRLRSILTGMDEQLALAIGGINDPDDQFERPAISPTGGLVGVAMRALEQAIQDRQISTQAAQTHRQAIIRTADSIERLRSLLDLYARGYLTSTELSARRESLLGRTRSAS